MKKRLLTFLSTILLIGTLASCGGGSSSSSNTSNGTTSGTNTDSSTSSVITSEAEEYLIRVSAPSGVTYSLSKQKAKAGETVVLTIESLPSGFAIQSVTLNSSTVLEASNNQYSFEMPNRSVTITIACSVEGDVTLIGDIVGVLQKEGDIYALRNVKVEKDGYNYFSFQIKAQDGTTTSLSSIDLDEYRCFADITSAYPSDYGLKIMGGNTYDFFYDPSAYRPCYVIRKEVHSLPSSVSTLYSLFDGSTRSESTVNYPGLNRIQYSTTNQQNINELKMLNYDMKIFEGNTSYALVNDLLESKTYHVYKHLDTENNLLEIVDTYPFSKGNDDRLRYSYNNYGAYSGRWDVVDSSIDDISRTEVNERDAFANVNHGAHYGYYLERDIMDAYRVGFNSDEVSTYKIDISSKRDEDSTSFTTEIDSYIEYNSTGGTFTSELHEAYIFKASISFDVAGKLKTLSYTKTKFVKDAWDFTSHEPLTGQDGTVVKTINATYSYGNEFSSSELTFDKTPYFISTIDNIHFYNAKTEMPNSDGKSYLHYGDKVSLNDLYNEKNSNLESIEFTPSTALDLWQYGPVFSSNEEVIRQEPTDLWYYMSCVGTGTATVRFSNHTRNTGTTFDLDINVNATQKFHGIYIYSTWGGYPGDVTSSTSANVTAGTIQSYKISVSPSSAPIIYTATSENPDLLKILSTGEKLTIDTTGAKDIKEPTVVRVRLDSEWFSDDVSTPYAMFSFTIIPMALNPIGTTWGQTDYQDHVQIHFTDEEVTSSSENKIYKGYVSDDGYVNETTSLGAFRADFIYQYVNGEVTASITSIYFEKNTDGWSTDPYDYDISFYYEASTDRFGLYIAEKYYDSDYEGVIFSPLYGDCDDDGVVTGYTPFERIN